MKEEYGQMLAFLDARLAARTRGFDLFSRELLATFLRAFAGNTKTVYVSGYAFPTELLWAFDVVPFDFEIACNNLPAAASGQGSTIMKIAEGEGWPLDMCSFDRLIIGCSIAGELPPGDLFLTSSYYCQGKAKANEIVAAGQGRRSVLFDVPNERSPEALAYVTAQLRDIAGMLEEVTGTKLDMDRLREAIRSANRARAAMLSLNAAMKARPCPWDGTKACLLSLAGAIFWGSPVLERIYGLLRAEIEERIAAGKVLPENRRILWFPWVPVQPTNIFPFLKERRISIPMVEVAAVWWSELDEERPFEALAGKALENYLLGPASRRARSLTAMAKEYGVDGAIHFATPACHHENAAFRIIADALREEGIPVLHLEGDMTDERKYSPARTADLLDSFVGMIEEAPRRESAS